jgi:hypothetical protein
LISRRPIYRLFAPLRLRASGVHGAETRCAPDGGGGRMAKEIGVLSHHDLIAAKTNHDADNLAWHFEHVLSRFAGAAAEHDRALIVNPHETEALGEAKRTALEMPLAERRERHPSMYKQLAHKGVDRWAGPFLSALAESRQRPRKLDSQRQLFAAAAI